MDLVNKNWLNWLNNISAKVLMPTVIITRLLWETVFNQFIYGGLEFIQNTAILSICVIFACNLLHDPKSIFLPWLKDNVLIVLFFIVRFVCWCQNEFALSILETVFIEAFLLMGIDKRTAEGKNIGKFYVKLFIYFELILVFFYIVNIVLPDEKEVYFFWGSINTFGPIAGFAAVLAIIAYGKPGYHKYFMLIVGIINLLVVFSTGCRNAIVGIILVGFFYLVKKTVPKISGKKLAEASLIICILFLVLVYGFVMYNQSKEYMSFTEHEVLLDDLSAARYTIWKACIITQKDDLLFGKGTMEIELENRKEFLLEADAKLKQRGRNILEEYKSAYKFYPHNDYIAMISCMGLLGFILLMLILLQKIKRSETLGKEKWYLAAVFAFSICCFDVVFIFNRFITCLYLFLILAIDMEADQDGQQIGSKTAGGVNIEEKTLEVQKIDQ